MSEAFSNIDSDKINVKRQPAMLFKTTHITPYLTIHVLHMQCLLLQYKKPSSTHYSESTISLVLVSVRGNTFAAYSNGTRPVARRQTLPWEAPQSG